jgi:hypothetical protein
MNSYALTHLFQVIFQRFPALGILFALAVMLLFGAAGFDQWQEYQSYPPEPRHMTVIQAAAAKGGRGFLVTVDDAKWDCGSIQYTNANEAAHTEAAFADEQGIPRGIATFDKKTTCADLQARPVAGVLSRARPGEPGPPLRLCTWCNRQSAQMGMLIFGALAFSGVILELIMARQLRRREDARM